MIQDVYPKFQIFSIPDPRVKKHHGSRIRNTGSYLKYIRYRYSTVNKVELTLMRIQFQTNFTWIRIRTSGLITSI
jgi:hypothetical protein